MEKQYIVYLAVLTLFISIVLMSTETYALCGEDRDDASQQSASIRRKRCDVGGGGPHEGDAAQQSAGGRKKRNSNSLALDILFEGLV